MSHPHKEAYQVSSVVLGGTECPIAFVWIASVTTDALKHLVDIDCRLHGFVSQDRVRAFAIQNGSDETFLISG